MSMHTPAHKDGSAGQISLEQARAVDETHISVPEHLRWTLPPLSAAVKSLDGRYDVELSCVPTDSNPLAQLEVLIRRLRDREISERYFLSHLRVSVTDKGDAGAAMTVPGYERLAAVLSGAYAQASAGKGKERHANGKPFHEQPMQDLIRLNGVGFATGQAAKKAGESLGFPADQVQRKVAEIYGAIVYLAGAVIALEDQAGKAQ